MKHYLATILLAIIGAAIVIGVYTIIGCMHVWVWVCGDKRK